MTKTATQAKKAVKTHKIDDPAALRLLYGIRFHHFATKTGRLVASIATEPMDPMGKFVNVACAVCASGDAPSRFRGRQIARGRLEVGKCLSFPVSELKRMISDRSLLAEFVSDHLATRLGYASCGDLIADLRPRREFNNAETV